MALGDMYATLDELKSYLGLAGQGSGVDDQMADALQSASQEIERHCDRQFNKATTATARLYVPAASCTMRVDDFWTTAGLVVETDEDGDGTFETTWAAADYELFPLAGNAEGFPYSKISAGGMRWFPYPRRYGRRARLRVTAQWGWPDVPAPVKQACLIMAAEAFQMKDAPLGVAGFGEFGVVRVRGNKAAAQRLQPYVRNPVLVG